MKLILGVFFTCILSYVNAGILKVSVACQDCFVIKVERLATLFLDACHADGMGTRYEVHTAVLLKSQVLWDVILCQGE